LGRQRNAAYDGAIRRAIAFRRAAGMARITALDVGAGSGLLTMMALRCAPGRVLSARVSCHDRPVVRI